MNREERIFVSTHRHVILPGRAVMGRAFELVGQGDELSVLGGILDTP